MGKEERKLHMAYLQLLLAGGEISFENAMTERRLPLKFPPAVLGKVKSFEYFLVLNHLRRHVHFHRRVSRPVTLKERDKRDV